MMRVLMAVLFLVFSGPARSAEIAHSAETTHTYKVAPRIPELKSFPCEKCHKGFKLGVLAGAVDYPHKGLPLHHMEELRKCTFCHSSRNPNFLNLLDGELVSYDESYKVCQQCHGPTAYNWSRGMHGRLTGQWNGERTIYVCVTCHQAHDPKFKPMAPAVAPFMPERVIIKGEHDGGLHSHE